ncbi:MAG: zinc-dependent peptidase [Flavobacteriales bacterium]|nr:zinc-dependent peptidase [Flavobacteriales bacterium]MCB9447908.1 zinc-dependent peptidase [Flavobacteriales bacterium]
MSYNKGAAGQFYHNKIRQRTPITREVFMQVHALLLERMEYYRNLDTKGQARFIHRLMIIRDQKQFHGREGLEVTFEMEVLISASVAQITYGMTEFSLTFFRHFLIYPASFYSKLLRRELLGGTTGNGVVMFSWRDYKAGYADDDDGRNLALHELAHCLKIHMDQGFGVDENFSKYFGRWMAFGQSEFDRMHAGKESFLRAYGGTNEHEFFAVCVEHFFEKPESFKKLLPEIYRHLCLLLNQDPLAKGNNYSLIDRRVLGKPLPKPRYEKVQEETTLKTAGGEKLADNNLYGNWHWVFSVLLASVFLSLPAIFIPRFMSAISTGELWLISALLVILAFPLQYKKVVVRDKFPMMFFLVYVVVGFVPIVLGGMLVLNLATAGMMKREVVHYEVEWIDGLPHRECLVGVKDAPGGYTDKILTLDYKAEYAPLASCGRLDLEVSTGILGVDVVWDKHLVHTPGHEVEVR